VTLATRLKATDARRRIRQLQAEHFTQAEIARRLGVTRFRPLRPVITAKTAARIARLYRTLMLEGADVPDPEAATVRRRIPR